MQGDLLNPLTGPVDLIVANLPYIRSDAFKTLQIEVRDFEPKEALVGGATGTHLVNQLIRTASAWLRPSGAIMLEIDPWQRDPLKKLIRKHLENATVRTIPDLSGNHRVIAIET